MTELRLFIALDFSKSMHKKIAAAQSELKTHFPQSCLRWVPEEKIHITLKFLGNISSDCMLDLEKALHTAASLSSICSAKISSLGAFPSLKKPNNIWIGVQPDQALLELYERLEESLESIKIPSEKRAFSPHITLARISQNATQPERMAISKKLQQIDIDELGTDKFSHLLLYKSEMHHGIYVYTILKSEAL